MTSNYKLSLFFLPVFHILIFLLLISTLSTTSKQTAKIRDITFTLIIEDDDPFKASQDFLSVENNPLFKITNQSYLRFATVPSHLAMETCSNTDSFTNLLLIARSDNEWRHLLRNLTSQASALQKTSNPGSRFHCRVLLFLQSCNNSISLQPGDFVNDTKILEKYNNLLPFNWKSDLYLIQYCEDQASINIWEVYSVKNTIFTKFLVKQQNREKFAVNLNLTEFSLAHMNNPKVVRRHDLGGVDVTAAAFINKDDENDNPFEIKLGDVNGKEQFISGFSVNILRDFKTALNFTERNLKIYFNIQNYFETSFLSDDYQFDINIFHVGITKNRTKVAQPLHPTFFDGVHAIFIQPTDRSVRNIYRKPFALQMWSVLFCTWTCIFITFKMTMYLLSKLRSNYQLKSLINIKQEKYIVKEPENDDDEPNHSTFEALLWCIGTMSQQGWHNLPTSTTPRLIISSGLLLSVLTYSAYTGKIVSELWDAPKPIKTLNQLLSYADKLYLISASDTSNDILEGLEQRSPELLKKVRFRDIDTIYRKLKDHPGKACTITWPDSLYGHAEETFEENYGEEGIGRIDAYLCDTFSSFTYQGTSNMFIPKWAELEQLFNYRILIGLERGFIRRYWYTYLQNTKIFCLRNNPKVTTLGFGDVFFSFFTLWFGMAMSVFFLTLECFIFWLWSKVPII